MERIHIRLNATSWLKRIFLWLPRIYALMTSSYHLCRNIRIRTFFSHSVASTVLRYVVVSSCSYDECRWCQSEEENLALFITARSIIVHLFICLRYLHFSSNLVTYYCTWLFSVYATLQINFCLHIEHYYCLVELVAKLFFVKVGQDDDEGIKDVGSVRSDQVLEELVLSLGLGGGDSVDMGHDHFIHAADISSAKCLHLLVAADYVDADDRDDLMPT